MTPAPPIQSLTDRFREYYASVVDLRRRIVSGSSGEELDTIREPLVTLLEGLETDDDRSADAVALREARYAMAAFADDQFTGFDWPLRDAWKSASLESKLFQTNTGGSTIFRRIDKLLEVGDPGQRGLARLYLLALSLGFRGDLAPESADRALRDYRQRLLGFAVPGLEAGAWSRRLSPTAYLHTIGRAVTEPLPNLRKWAWLALGAVLLLLVVTHLVWHDAVQTIGAIVDRVPTGGPAK